MNLLRKLWKKKRNDFVANPIYHIMHFEIPASFVQSKQATWVQECEAALGFCLQRPLEQEIFSLLTVTATLTIVHFVWFRDFGIQGEILFQNIK